MPLALVVVTPAARVLELAVERVTAPGSEGQFTVLPGHERVLAPLNAGVLEYEHAGRVSRLRIGGGFAEVQPDQVTVLADSAETFDA
jgi:F-type H+-transporting ATPase subunit epsilon